MKTKVNKDERWNKDQIKFLIQNSDLAIERALLALYERQTADEQSSEDTKHHNLQGFTQADANYFSRLAKKVLVGNRLTYREIGFLRSGKSKRFPSRIGKYARQLAEIANLKIIDAEVAIMRYKNMNDPAKLEFWEQRKQSLLPTRVQAKMLEQGKLLV